MATRGARRIINHLLFWLVYFLFWTGYCLYSLEMPLLWALVVTATYFVAEAGTFYICLYFLMPRFFMPGRYVVFAASVLAVFIVAAAGTTFGLMPVLPSIFNEQADDQRYNGKPVYPFIYPELRGDHIAFT